MAKFQFRLQKVLEHRQRLEEEARNALLEVQVQRLGLEQQILDYRQEQTNLTRQDCDSVEAHKTIQLAIDRLDDEVAMLNTALSIVIQEQETAQSQWIFAKQELRAMELLLERDLEEWKLEQERQEQKSLDEWTTSRMAKR